MIKHIFKRYGGSYQLKMENALDLEKIQDLPEVHWAATSIPVADLNCDSEFMAFLDKDQDGRILSNDLKITQEWFFKMLSDVGTFGRGFKSVKLSEINVSHGEGETLLSAAKFILKNLKIDESDEVTLDQVREVKKIVSEARYNGDGIIPPDTVKDEEIVLMVKNIMDTIGFSTDASGKKGVGEKELDMFLSEAQEYVSWKESRTDPEGGIKSDLVPFGEETQAFYGIFNRMSPKIEQFFMQSAIAQIDNNLIPFFRLRQEEIEKSNFADNAFLYETARQYPLCSNVETGELDLEAGINPVYLKDLIELRDKVIHRVLGESVKKLGRNGWEKIKDSFAPYGGWINAKKGERVEAIGEELLERYLSSDLKDKLREIMKKDLSVRAEIDKINDVEKLILCRMWLLEIANNFVSFTNLYDPSKRALFEVGTLVIDGREMTFSMKVKNRQEHKKISAKSFMFLVYLKITGKEKDITGFDVVVPVTSGFAGRISVGKRGVFFTVDGKEWDAEVVDVLVNPISIWESVLVPFQKISEFFKEQVEKFNKSSQTKLEGSLGTATPSGTARDLLLGGGVAVAALGSSLAYITKAVSGVRASHVLITIGSLVLFLFLPGLIMGILRIKKRDMSIMLEASGWAVNVEMRINRIMGSLFTNRPALPMGSYTEKFDTAGKFLLVKRSLLRIFIASFSAIILLSVISYYLVYYFYRFK